MSATVLFARPTAPADTDHWFDYRMEATVFDETLRDLFCSSPSEPFEEDEWFKFSLTMPIVDRLGIRLFDERQDRQCTSAIA